MRHARTALTYGNDITNDLVMQLQPFEWADEQVIVSPAMIRTNIGCKLTNIGRYLGLRPAAGVLDSMQGSESYDPDNSRCLGMRIRRNVTRKPLLDPDP
jgi:hypothetical protein